MSNNELKRVLQDIQNYCKRHGSMCEGCKFSSAGGCTINNIPQKWRIDEIGKKAYIKWNELNDYLLDMRRANSLPFGVKDPYDSARKIRDDLLAEIIVYMNQLDEEDEDGYDET